MNCSADFFCRFIEDFTQVRADGMTKADVGNNAIREEGIDTVTGAVDELVRDKQVTRSDLFF